MKKISIALVLCIVLSAFAVTASAVDFEEQAFSSVVVSVPGGTSIANISVPDSTTPAPTTTMSVEESIANAVVAAATTPNYGSIAKFQVGAINEVIGGAKRFIESLCDAEWPTKADAAEDTTVEATEAEATTEAEIANPDTGDSAAVASALVAVLALGTVGVVALRKKED